MLDRETLKVLLQTPGLSQSEKSLICLASKDPTPLSVSELRDIGVGAGLREMGRWNVSRALRSTDGLAVLSEEGWELTGPGRQAVADIVSEHDHAPFDWPGGSEEPSKFNVMDEDLEHRCLPVLAEDATDPKRWDTAVRNAGVVLEQRLRQVGGIDDQNLTGRDLVNAVFGDRGTLTGEFEISSERQGYRDLYAGVVGAFRNPSAHRFVDPRPEDGKAFITFVDLLLRRLDELG